MVLPLCLACGGFAAAQPLTLPAGNMEEVRLGAGFTPMGQGQGYTLATSSPSFVVRRSTGPISNQTGL